MKTLRLLATLLLSFAYVHANDFDAGRPGHGIQIVQNDSIQMYSEVLKITPDLVDVTYVYKNLTDEERTIRIGFPIGHTAHDLETHINDVKVEWKVERYEDTHVYLREQVFKPREVVQVHHRYTPYNGSGIYGVLPSRGSRRSHPHSDACSSFTDEELLQQRDRPGEKTEHLEYILTTGANWAGPIKKFRLEIGPSSRWPTEVYGLLHCFEGLESTSDNRYVAEIDDFVPRHNLYLIFYHTPEWWPADDY
jgi:hypothetical protein